MIKKLLLILPLFFLFYFTITLAADKHYIRGKVIDESGERLSGVTVRVKEQKSIGTSTDDKGEFSIKLYIRTFDPVWHVFYTVCYTFYRVIGTKNLRGSLKKCPNKI